MATPNLYVQKADAKKSLELTGTTFADRDLERALAAASEAIDQTCGRRFWLDSEPVARRYTAISRDRCMIDDLPMIEVSDPDALAVVEIDTAGDGSFETTWELGTDYDFEPMNAAADDEPFTELRALAGSFPAERGAVRVTAQFGWLEIPHVVVQATLLLSNRLLVRARQAPFGLVVAGIDVGVAMRIARSDPDVQGLLAGVSRVPTLRSVQLT